jgi:undecaprenyl-diphosphatase
MSPGFMLPWFSTSEETGSAMTELDVEIILWLNQYSRNSPIFDGLVVVVNRYHLFRGVVMVALLWWAWAASNTRLVTPDLGLVRIALGLLAGIAVARGLQRPAHEPGLDLQPPLGFTGAEALEDWSSFPSDHAVLIMALVVAVLHLDRRLGLLALVWAICIVLPPRVYLGLHYPSDMVGGAVLGAAIMAAALHVWLPPRLAPALARLEDRHRGLAYAGFFVFSYLCASMFNDARELLRALGRFAEMVLS